MDRKGLGMAPEYTLRQGEAGTESRSVESYPVRYADQYGRTGFKYDHVTRTITRTIHTKRFHGIRSSQRTVKWHRKTFLPPYSCYMEWISRYPKWKCWDLSRSHRESVLKPESRPASRSTICYNRFLCPVHVIKGKMRNAGGLRNIIIIIRNHSSRIFFYTFVTLLIKVKSNL